MLAIRLFGGEERLPDAVLEFCRLELGADAIQPRTIDLKDVLRSSNCATPLSNSKKKKKRKRNLKYRSNLSRIKVVNDFWSVFSSGAFLIASLASKKNHCSSLRK